MPTIPEIEARIRREFPPERWYELMVRVAAHVEFSDRAAEHRTNEVLALAARVERIEARCPRTPTSPAPPPCEAAE